jgi:(5-formylfuran-3-yl)methyl phosphate synthase
MTRLLVSVVDAAEARIALEAGVDLVDVKDPTKGSLGAPDSGTIAGVVAEIAGRLPVSVALGELRDWVHMRDLASLARVRYAKLGMAGLDGEADWPWRWENALRQLSPNVQAVAVVYADWPAAAAPEPARVLAEAERLGCAAVLVDTFDKSGGSLVDWWDLETLASFTASIRRRGMLAVLGGSLSFETVPRVAAQGPDYIAVRGAVCRAGRAGPLAAGRVRRMAGLLAEINAGRFSPLA